MKKKKKIVLFIIAVVITLYTIFWWDEIIIKTQLRIRCWKDYHTVLKIEKVYVNDEKEKVSIYFVCEENITEENKNIIFSLYNEAYNILFEGTNDRYDGYEMYFCIRHRSKYPVIAFDNVTKGMSQMTVSCNSDVVTIGDIAKNCHGTIKLTIGRMKYESLEEFVGFTNLKTILCSDDIVDEDESEYILNLFPECEIWDQNDK